MHNTATRTSGKLDGRLLMILRLAESRPGRGHGPAASDKPGAGALSHALPSGNPLPPPPPGSDVSVDPTGVVTVASPHQPGGDEDADVPEGEASLLPPASPPSFDDLFEMDAKAVQAGGVDAARFFHGFSYDAHNRRYMVNAIFKIASRPQPPDGGDDVFRHIEELGGAVVNTEDVQRQMEEGNANVFAMAKVPLSSVDPLAGRSDVAFIELGRPMRPQLGKSVGKVVGRPWTAKAGLTGDGVLVGVIDVGGLDFHHADFRYNAPLGTKPGQTRLLGLDSYDERTNTYTVYSEADINADLAAATPYSVVRQPVMRRWNHPTAVAGVAAGDGSTLGTSPGVAPGAALYYVNASTTLAALGRPTTPFKAVGDSWVLALGLVHTFYQAKQRGLPCVVNVSLGDSLGAHDGTSGVEQLIDLLLKDGDHPGRAVVVAAGNCNQAKKHVAFEVGGPAFASRPGAPRSKRLALVVPDGVQLGETIQIWYEGPPVPAATVFVHGPKLSAAATGSPSPAAPAFSIRKVPAVPSVSADVRVGNKAAVVTVSSDVDGANGDHCITIGLLPVKDESEVSPGNKRYPHDSGTVPSGTWEIELRWAPLPAPIRVHAWIDTNTAMFWEEASKDVCTLTTPATARHAISVGAFDTSPVTPKPSAGPADRNELCQFSGRGPTRDGRDKPELVAPGVSIQAPAPTKKKHRHVRGTSFAAPHVAGLVALMFERSKKKWPADPLPNTRQIVTMLSESALRTGVYAPALDGSAWGFAHTPDVDAPVPALGSVVPIPLEPPSLGPANVDRTLYPLVQVIGDMQQIDIGYYEVYQDASTNVIGELLVVSHNGDIEEHWGFYDGYELVSRDICPTELGFNYLDESYGNGVADFINRLEGLSGEILYIRAPCEMTIY